jgi:hypothetical protein
MAALREALDQLPLRARRALALRFGAGLEWQEMAVALEEPPLLVAADTQDALKSLRVSLARTWPSGGGDFVNAKNLEEAICSGVRVPAGLRDRILNRIASHERHGMGVGLAARARLRSLLLRFRHVIT